MTPENTGPTSPTSPSPATPAWPAPFRHLVGLDWAGKEHVLCAVDERGAIAWRLTISNDLDGWARLKTHFEKLGAASTIAVAVETNCGMVVEQVLNLGVSVYPVPPAGVKAYRERTAGSGAKDDELDAYCLADALRTDGHRWRVLRQDSEHVRRLRLLCRDEIHLIEKRTALYLELRAALRECYPTVLEAFEDITLVCVLDFLTTFPSAAELARKGKKSWRAFLHTHRMAEPESYQRRMAIFATAAAWKVPVPVVQAKSLLVAALVAQIRLLNQQLKTYGKQIEEVFDTHQDAGLFASLPGVGAKLGPRLLAFIGSDRERFESSASLQCYGGTAPVTRSSGKFRAVARRLACDKDLANALFQMAEGSCVTCAWAKVYLDSKKKQMGYAAAVRALAQRWVKIIWKMWQTGTPYDEATHLKNQVEHGSWVLALNPAPAPAAA